MQVIAEFLERAADRGLGRLLVAAGPGDVVGLGRVDEHELLHPVEQILGGGDVAVGVRVEVGVRGRGEVEDRVDPARALRGLERLEPGRQVEVALRLDVGVGPVRGQPARERGHHLGAERGHRADVVERPGALVVDRVGGRGDVAEEAGDLVAVLADHGDDRGQLVEERGQAGEQRRQVVVEQLPQRREPLRRRVDRRPQARVEVLQLLARFAVEVRVGPSWRTAGRSSVITGSDSAANRSSRVSVVRDSRRKVAGP